MTVTFSSPYVEVTKKGRIAVLTLNRPEKRNAVCDALIEDVNKFVAALNEGARKREVDAVVIRGAGGHFCAGLDLAEHKDRPPFEGVKHSMFWHDTLERLEFGPIPVERAAGCVLAHSLTAGGASFKKGRVLSADDIARRFPAFAPGAFADGFYHALGGFAESGRVVAALIGLARARGIDVYENRTVARLLDGGGERVSGLETREGDRLEAGAVVVASGAWTPARTRPASCRSGSR